MGNEEKERGGGREGLQEGSPLSNVDISATVCVVSLKRVKVHVQVLPLYHVVLDGLAKHGGGETHVHVRGRCCVSVRACARLRVSAACVVVGAVLCDHMASSSVRVCAHNVVPGAVTRPHSPAPPSS